jgi:hypothetical protein
VGSPSVDPIGHVLSWSRLEAHRGAGRPQLDSEQFRSVPRTFRPLYGRLRIVHCGGRSLSPNGSLNRVADFPRSVCISSALIGRINSFQDADAAAPQLPPMPQFWLRRTNVCRKITSPQIMGAGTMKGSALRDVEREGLNRRFDPLCQLAPAVNGRGNCPRASRHPAINVNWLTHARACVLFSQPQKV